MNRPVDYESPPLPPARHRRNWRESSLWRMFILVASAIGIVVLVVTLLVIVVKILLWPLL